MIQTICIYSTRSAEMSNKSLINVNRKIDPDHKLLMIIRSLCALQLTLSFFSSFSCSILFMCTRHMDKELLYKIFPLDHRFKRI